MTLLRERMAEDLRIRNYSPRTVECYVSMVARVAREFVEPPGQLGPEEFRAFHVRRIEKKVSSTQFNQAVCALRFFYRVMLPRDFAVEHIPFAKTKRKLPAAGFRPMAGGLRDAPGSSCRCACWVLCSAASAWQRCAWRSGGASWSCTAPWSRCATPTHSPPASTGQCRSLGSSTASHPSAARCRC